MNERLRKTHTFKLPGGYQPVAGNEAQGVLNNILGLPFKEIDISADNDDNPYLVFGSNVTCISNTKFILAGNGIATLMILGRGQLELYRFGTDYATLNPNAVFPTLFDGAVAPPGESGIHLTEGYKGVGTQAGEVIALLNRDLNTGLPVLNREPNIPNDLYPTLYPEHVAGANPWLNTYFAFNRFTRILTLP